MISEAEAEAEQQEQTASAISCPAGRARSVRSAAGLHALALLEPDQSEILDGVEQVDDRERDNRRRKAPGGDRDQTGRRDQRHLVDRQAVAAADRGAIVQAAQRTIASQASDRDLARCRSNGFPRGSASRQRAPAERPEVVEARQMRDQRGSRRDRADIERPVEPKVGAAQLERRRCPPSCRRCATGRRSASRCDGRPRTPRAPPPQTARSARTSRPAISRTGTIVSRRRLVVEDLAVQIGARHDRDQVGEGQDRDADAQARRWRRRGRRGKQDGAARSTARRRAPRRAGSPTAAARRKRAPPIASRRIGEAAVQPAAAASLTGKVDAIGPPPRRIGAALVKLRWLTAQPLSSIQAGAWSLVCSRAARSAVDAGRLEPPLRRPC